MRFDVPKHAMNNVDELGSILVIFNRIFLFMTRNNDKLFECQCPVRSFYGSLVFSRRFVYISVNWQQQDEHIYARLSYKTCDYNIVTLFRFKFKEKISRTKSLVIHYLMIYIYVYN